MKTTTKKPVKFDDRSLCTVEIEYGDLQKKIESITDGPIIFSIFESVSGGGSDEWIVKIPDLDSTEPVFTGKRILFIDYWRVSDKVVSRKLDHPTWVDLIRAVDDMLKGGDGCGVFLEAFYIYLDGRIEASISS